MPLVARPMATGSGWTTLTQQVRCGRSPHLPILTWQGMPQAVCGTRLLGLALAATRLLPWDKGLQRTCLHNLASCTQSQVVLLHGGLCASMCHLVIKGRQQLWVLVVRFTWLRLGTLACTLCQQVLDMCAWQRGVLEVAAATPTPALRVPAPLAAGTCRFHREKPLWCPLEVTHSGGSPQLPAGQLPCHVHR